MPMPVMIDPHQEAECYSCLSRWTGAELKPIEDFYMRVNAGEEVPAGQCPLCDCLCYIIDEETIDLMRDKESIYAPEENQACEDETTAIISRLP